MSEIGVKCKHCQHPMGVPKTFTGKFAEFRCSSCGKTFGVVPSDTQERVLSRGAEKIMERIQQRAIEISQDILGLPLCFKPVKEIKYAVMRRVEVVSPKGHNIDIGAVTFSDEGKLLVFDDSNTLTLIVDKLDPKDRF